MSGPREPDLTAIRLDDDESGHIVTLTLNRPEAMNAISRGLAADLYSACMYLRDCDEVRVVIVTGAGKRAFCAGADLKERKSLAVEDRARHTAEIEQAAEALAALPMPTIASIRGYALAGGAELAIACDVRVAASDAVLGFPEVKIGIFPGAGGVLRLPRIVGSGAARDLLFTGRHVDATEALQLGLVDRVRASEAAFGEARAIASAIAGSAPLAVRAVKMALRESELLLHERGRAKVNALRASLDETADYEEGLRAFTERRPARFTGH